MLDPVGLVKYGSAKSADLLESVNEFKLIKEVELPELVESDAFSFTIK